MIDTQNDKLMSIVLLMFTATITVMVIFALVSSASILAQVIAFMLALLIFISAIFYLIVQVNQLKNDLA
ncbi:MAG: hypothetical protein ACFE0Q_18515 [Anaerolineae bacterium]